MLKKLSLGVKMMSGFLFVSLITLAVGIMGLFGLDYLEKTLRQVGGVQLPSIQALLTIQQNKTAILLAERSLLLAKSKEEIGFQTKRLDGYWSTLDNSWRLYESLPKTDEETVIWQELQPIWQQWKESHDEVVSLVNDHSSLSMEKAMKLSYGRVREKYIAADELLAKTIAINEKVAFKNKTTAERAVKVIFTMAILSIVIGILAAVLIGYFLTRAITKPVVHIIEGLNESSQQVAAASNQLSEASQQQAEGNAELASSIEETSSTLEESSSMIQQNSENTRQAALLAAQAKDSADKGNREMQAMMVAMGELKKSSDQVAKIIKVIDEIAFQTNILALNAAVEAARAGDAGMGFAVVAEEVRNLAQRSAQAAKDTAELIERNIELSENGLTSAEKVGVDLNDITQHAKKVNELVDEIAAAGQEQSQGILQINKAIAQMEKATQQNAASAEESAAAAEELNAQAENMQDAVQKLVMLVEGHAVNIGNSRNTYISKNKIPSAAVKLQDNRRLLAKPGEMKHTRIVNPEDIIPLEDDPQDF